MFLDVSISLVRRALDRLCSLGGVLGLALSVFVWRRWRAFLQSRRGCRGGRGRVTGGDTRSRGSQGPQGPQGSLRGTAPRSDLDVNVTAGDVPRTQERSGAPHATQSLSCSLPQYITKTFKTPSLVVSIPSLLILESSPILESATPHGPTVSYLKSQLRGYTNANASFTTYLVCHVEDDVGEAVVMAMLEHCGLVPDMIPAHRVVFVDEVGSLVSVVRQLDPGGFVCGGVGSEGCGACGVCEELRRFYKERGRIACLGSSRGVDSGEEEEKGSRSRFSVELFV